ncbi:hypothetical protein NKH60_34215 [Mesorhizobium sp. M1006]|uniref:hypothetical protein n=1 Tax=Mesorhizobium sp. M1006 TaxID=2957048 RepID=UPI00333A96DF
MGWLPQFADFFARIALLEAAVSTRDITIAERDEQLRRERAEAALRIQRLQLQIIASTARLRPLVRESGPECGLELEDLETDFAASVATHGERCDPGPQLIALIAGKHRTRVRARGGDSRRLLDSRWRGESGGTKQSWKGAEYACLSACVGTRPASTGAMVMQIWTADINGEFAIVYGQNLATQGRMAHPIQA